MLPKSALELIEIIGELEAHRLIKVCGGTTLFIPSKHTEQDLISKEAWASLCKRYAGTYLFVPRCYKVMLKIRNDTIVIDRNSGLTIAKLAIKYHLTDRQITTICGSSKDSGTRNASYDLFDSILI